MLSPFCRGRVAGGKGRIRAVSHQIQPQTADDRRGRDARGLRGDADACRGGAVPKHGIPHEREPDVTGGIERFVALSHARDAHGHLVAVRRGNVHVPRRSRFRPITLRRPNAQRHGIADG